MTDPSAATRRRRAEGRRPYALVNAKVVDGTGRPPLERAAISIDGARITEVRDLSRDEPPVCDHIDATGLTVLPGLIDAHTHLGHAADSATLRDLGEISTAEVAAEVFRNLEIAVDEGFTSVRELGGVDGGVARAVQRRLIAGPRVFPSGPALAQTGGHGTHLGPFSLHDATLAVPGLLQRTIVCDGESEVRRAARLAFRRGATQLKVYASGGVVSSSDAVTDAQFSTHELRVMVEEAEARGTYVTAHAHSLAALRNGLQAGIRCFEHATFLDAATATQLAAAGSVVVPTLTVVDVMPERWQAWGLSEQTLDRLEGVGDAMVAAMKLARAAGVLLGSGSDLLGPRQHGRGREILLKARALTPMDALVCATRNNARLLNVEERLGTVEDGKVADLIAVSGDPLDEPDLFTDVDAVALVIQDGVPTKDRESRCS